MNFAVNATVNSEHSKYYHDSERHKKHFVTILNIRNMFVIVSIHHSVWYIQNIVINLNIQKSS